MNKNRLFLRGIIVLTMLSLTLTSSSVKEEAERVYADDYDTYLGRHYSASAANSCTSFPLATVSEPLGEPVQVFFRIIQDKPVTHPHPSASFPRYILHRRLLI